MFSLGYIKNNQIDKVVDPFQIRDFSNWSKSNDQTNFFVKDMWHSVVFDEEFSKLTPEIIKWILIKSI